jgi:hypothetical protein
MMLGEAAGYASFLAAKTGGYPAVDGKEVNRLMKENGCIFD